MTTFVFVSTCTPYVNASNYEMLIVLTNMITTRMNHQLLQRKYVIEESKLEKISHSEKCLG